MLSTDGQMYSFVLRPKGRLSQTYMDILEGVSSPWRKLQTNQGLCKRLARPGSRIKASLWGKKDKSPATDLHFLRGKLNMFCGPCKFRLTRSLGRIKSCLEKQKTWKLGHYIHLQHWCHARGEEGKSEQRQSDDGQPFSFGLSIDTFKKQISSLSFMDGLSKPIQ